MAQALALTVAETARLTDLEAVVERGLATFVDVGNALLAIRDARLYRPKYGTFEVYCQERWGMSRSRAHRLIEAAEVGGNLLPIGNILPTNEAQARPLSRLEPDAQREAWARVLDNAQGGRITAAQVEAAVDEMTGQGPVSRTAQLHVSDDSYEWYTPAEYIEAARAVMGSIDLDPASCATANEVVKAMLFYDARADGLRQAWRGNVWLNPPYNMPWIENFIDRALAFYASGACPQVFVLTNNSTDTAWFHKLMAAGPFCLTRGRIHFWGEAGVGLATRQGQAIFYLGPNVGRFVTLFGTFGMIVEAICDDQKQEGLRREPVGLGLPG